MNLQAVWTQTMQLRHRATAVSIVTPKTPAKRPQRRPKPQSKEKATRSTVTIEAPTLKTEKETGPVASRNQIPKLIGSHNGKITGTDIPFKAGKCNNWQVWSHCEILNTPRGCKWDHSCKLHGAGACPYK